MDVDLRGNPQEWAKPVFDQYPADPLLAHQAHEGLRQDLHVRASDQACERLRRQGELVLLPLVVCHGVASHHRDRIEHERGQGKWVETPKPS